MCANDLCGLHTVGGEESTNRLKNYSEKFSFDELYLSKDLEAVKYASALQRGRERERERELMYLHSSKCVLSIVYLDYAIVNFSFKKKFLDFYYRKKCDF